MSRYLTGHSKMWQRWSWDEIYRALMRERELGEVLELESHLIGDPVESGAELGSTSDEWHYRFSSSDGYALCVQHRGTRYVAWLERLELHHRPMEWQSPWASLSSLHQAVAGGALVLCGGLWVVLERTLLI